MPLPPPIRAGLASRNLVTALVLALCAALVLAAAAPASAVTRKQATKKALKALGSKNGSDAVIVFGLANPLRPGSRVTQVGTRKGAPLVARVGRERAFFFYEDSGPFQLYPHAGRVALVRAKTGKVTLSKGIMWAPLVNGKLPAFLKNYKRYTSPEYRVFAKSSNGGANGGNGNGPNHAPKADDQSVTVKQNVPKNITLTGSDDEDAPLTFDITDPPDHGTLSGQPPNVTYTPDLNYLGKDKFAFRADDGVDSNVAHVTINVKPTGAPPTVTTSAGCMAYTEQAPGPEQAPGFAIDPSLTVSDSDDTTLDHATVRIPVDPPPPPPEGEDPPEPSGTADGDELWFADQNGITGSYEDRTGTLTLSGEASVANYQTALRSVRYRNLQANPPPTRDVEFIVNDAGTDSVAATKQICITEGGAGDNNKPIGETSEGVLDYIENDGPMPVDAGFIVLDADSANLSGATIKFTESQPPEDEEGNPIGDPVNNFAPDEDELVFVDDVENGIFGSYNDETGVMTLSGTASLAAYEAAIRSVTYENSSEDPSGAPRTIRFQLTDSTGALSVPSNRGILVTPVNDAPVVTTSEGSESYIGDDPAVTVDSGLTAGDVDDDDLEGAVVRISSGFEPGDDLLFVDTLEISGIYNTGTGVLTLTGTASVEDYQAALRTIKYRNIEVNPAGSRTIEFTVNDGDLDSEPATKNIDVNDKPVLDTTDAALSYIENDGSVAVDSGIAAADADSADLVGATVQITTNFTPDEDQLDFATQSGITGEYDDVNGTLTLSGTASVEEYRNALGDVRYENSSENPSAATRTVTFQANDGATNNNLSDPVTRDIEVTPVNDAPVVTTTEDSTAYTEGDPPTVVDAGVTVADVDDTDLASGQVRISGDDFQLGDELAFDEESHPGITGAYNTDTGILTLTGPAPVEDFQAALASITYSHSGDNPSASKTVEFTVHDGDDDSNTASKEIAVAPVNDAPVVTTTSEGDTSYTVDGPAVTVDSGVTVADVDDTDLASAVVRIASDDFEPGDQLELDEESLSGGIAVDFFPATGVMTLTGPAPVEDFQAALAAVKYQHIGATSAASKTIEFTVHDGDVDSDVATKEIAIEQPPSGNVAPVVATSGTPTTYTPGDTEGVVVDSGVTVTDIDDTQLDSGVVRIAIGDFVLGDELMFDDTLEIDGEYDPDTGILTLTGTALIADWEAALQTIKYRHTGDGPNATTTVEFTVYDGDVDSNTASKLIVNGTPPE